MKAGMTVLAIVAVLSTTSSQREPQHEHRKEGGIPETGDIAPWNYDPGRQSLADLLEHFDSGYWACH
jgi:hypothetical protein